jgi:hypothetical protein
MGMADALITRLSGIRDIVVRPMSSVRKYSELKADVLAAGRELGVESVLEGSLQRQGNRVRVTDFQIYLQSKPDARLTLQGHADPRGSAEYNQALSERRVERTKRFLVELGVPAANIQTEAFGKQKNLSAAEVKAAVERNPELSPEDRRRVLNNMRTIILASNRRVDITLSSAGQTSQESVRQYPFNAADSLTLLKEEKTKKTRPFRRKAKPKAQQ